LFWHFGHRVTLACKSPSNARNKAVQTGLLSGTDKIKGKNMAGTVEQKLASQGIVLHEPPTPVANYVGFVRSANLLFVSGQVCVNAEGKLIARGKLGAGVSVEQGNAAARGCAINLLAQVKAALGDLDKVVRVVRLGGFVNSAADFVDGPKVLNGASDLMVAAFWGQGPTCSHHRRCRFAALGCLGRGGRSVRGFLNRAVRCARPTG
jgi:enamine deaminase RidA (YjgF/YER057c/UK114 family)